MHVADRTIGVVQVRRRWLSLTVGWDFFQYLQQGTSAAGLRLKSLRRCAFISDMHVLITHVSMIGRSVRISCASVALVSCADDIDV